jgi:hypothetical protein
LNGDERAGKNYRSAATLHCKRADRCLNFCVVAHRSGDDLHLQKVRSRPQFADGIVARKRTVGIEQVRHAIDLGRDFLEHLEPFTKNRIHKIDEAGDIAAGVSP